MHGSQSLFLIVVLYTQTVYNFRFFKMERFVGLKERKKYLFLEINIVGLHVSLITNELLSELDNSQTNHYNFEWTRAFKLLKTASFSTIKAL